MLYFGTVGYLAELVKKSYNGLISYVGTFSGLRGNATNVSSVQMVSPYGHGAIPPIGLPAFILPINGSHKSNACVGYFTEIVDNIKDKPVQGEGWLYSQNYVLLARLNGIRAYKYANTTYYATLPNGEFTGQMMQNRITELENTISKINDILNRLDSSLTTHVHSGVQPGTGMSGSPSTPFPPMQLPIPSTLSQDSNYISNENYLINDKGTLYGQ